MAYTATQTVESGSTQSAAAANNSPTGPLTALSVGDSVVGRMMWEGGDSTPTVSDSAGNTYVVGSPQFSDGGVRMAHFYLLSAANAGSSVIVTGSFGVDTRTNRHIIATRGSTLAGALSVTFPVLLDTPGTGTDALACPAINVSSAPAVIIAHAFDLDLGGPPAAGTGYTDIGSALGNCRVEYKTFAGTSASEAATFTSSYGSHAFAYGAMAFTEGAAAATLSSATPSGTLGTTTTASLGATTNQTSGTFYGVVDSAGNLSGVTASQVKAGQKASGAAALSSGNSSVSTTTPSIPITGLSSGTLYSYAVIQNNTNGDSNMLTGTFTTASVTPNPGVRQYGLQGSMRTIIGL
jgi:hypothetical protein